MTSERKPPDGWRHLSLEEVVPADAPIIYGILQPGPDTPGGVPYVRPTEIVGDEIQLDEVRRTTDAIAKKYHRARLKRGDVLLSIVGTIGKVAVVPRELEGGNITQSSARVRPEPTVVTPEYLAWVLRSPDARRDYREVQLGTGVPRLNISQVREQRVPVAPLAQQRCIVAKIEALTQKSRRAKEALDAIPPLLERFRQSVLASAFRGDLTKDWRAKHPDVEPAAALLERIRQERRNRWEEAELAKLKAKGKPPKDDRWKQRYEEPAPVDAEGLPELPDGWCWASVGELSHSLSYGTAEKSARAGEVPVLRMGNLQAGEIDWSDLVFTSGRSEIAKYRLAPNTVLFNRTNSPELVGKTALYRGERPAVFAGYLISIGNVAQIAPAYINWALNSPYGRAWCWRVKSDGVSQSNISAAKLATFPIPVCSFDEQQVVVQASELMLRLAIQVSRHVRDASGKREMLDTAILAKAFRGELTSDASND